jgi:hypothetical protein
LEVVVLLEIVIPQVEVVHLLFLILALLVAVLVVAETLLVHLTKQVDQVVVAQIGHQEALTEQVEQVHHHKETLVVTVE